ncbi:hypothetical protein B0T24DRAFT_642103 [Lasiosphaeria ovina]|uniref:F-box domain-containing protein n=1 Tax=Lasiosphaeria ovina TaxID=92902 RepID=A0AAE0MZS2_9PEZI|nr:hypothetical protein B0T24DRAFT_642103 [Lasiosphaeria ovina]
MSGQGVVSCIIRFACHIPTGMMGVTGLGLWKNARDVGPGIFDAIPHGWDFLEGLRVVGSAGIATFAWNFFMFAASNFCRGALLGTVGLVDLALAVALAVGAGKQSIFLPRSYGGCDGAATPGPTGQQNFFVVANSTGLFSEDSGADICHDMVQNWAVTVAVVVIYLICAIVNISVGFADSCSGGYGSRRSWDSWSGYDIDVIISPLLWLLSPVIRAVDYLQAGGYFGYRYSRSALSALADGKSPKPPANNINNNTAAEKNRAVSRLINPFSGGSEKKPPAQHAGKDVHLPLELAIMVARHVHYADLVSVSQSSKRLRSAFFGVADPTAVLDELQQHCCRPTPTPTPTPTSARTPSAATPSATVIAHTSRCRLCNIPMCNDCRADMASTGADHATIDARTTHHLTRCRARCSRCFFAKDCRWNWYRPGERRTNWIARSRNNNTGDRAMQVDVEMGGGGAGTGGGYVCSNCARRPAADIDAVLDSRAADEVRRLAALPLACESCSDALPAPGPRWWIDADTEKECKWAGHPPWAKSLSYS